MTGETNPGLLFLLSGKRTLRGARGSLAVGPAGWQEKCSLQDTAQISPLVTVQSFRKKVWRVHSSWVFFLPRLEERRKTCVPAHGLRTQLWVSRKLRGDLSSFLACICVCKAFSARTSHAVLSALSYL